MVEVNASDTRSKADAKTTVGVAGKTSNRIKEMVDSTRLNFEGGRGSGKKQVRGGGGHGGCVNRGWGT